MERDAIVGSEALETSTSALRIAAVEPETIEIASITRDVVVRAKGTDRATVAAYAQAMRDGAIFPPVVLYRDRTGLRLAEGAHRIDAALANGLTTIAAEVRQGGRKEALQHAVSTGRDFGLRFSTRDKRHQCEMMLGNFPKWSDRKIADALGVDHKTVAATKRRLADVGGEIPQGEPEQADPCEKPLAKFRALLALVPEAERARFAELVLALLAAPEAVAAE
jgi:hypothetical protein